MERITSSHNPLVQHMRKLQTSRAYRESCGEFVADGWKLLEEALKWYPEVTAVLTSEPERCPALPSSARLVEVPASLMQSVSSMRTPQGVLFSLRLPQEGALRVQPGMLLLDRIQDPGNLGTILRTADAFDLPVLLTIGTADYLWCSIFSKACLNVSSSLIYATSLLGVRKNNIFIFSLLLPVFSY